MNARVSLRSLARWEVLLAVTLLLLVWLGSRLSSVFVSPQNFANLTVAEMEIGIIAVPMTLVERVSSGST